jgi:peptide methionine sulfoxide reductase MsrA
MRSNSGYVELPKEAVKSESFNDIKKAKRLFYHEVDMNIPTKKWIEIFNVKDFVKEEEYHQKHNIKGNCSMKSYLDHHNFHITF